MQLPENAKRSLAEKQFGLLVLTNDMYIQEKRSCTQKRPNSLANASHAASEFQKQRLTFLSINIITRYFDTMQSPENHRHHLHRD